MEERICREFQESTVSRVLQQGKIRLQKTNSTRLSQKNSHEMRESQREIYQIDERQSIYLRIQVGQRERRHRREEGE